MSVEKIRAALGRLHDDPDNVDAWNELAEAVTAPGVVAADVERMLDLARGEHERRREWGAVAKLLEIQISFAQGTAVEAPMQAELARVYHEELCDAEHAAEAYRHLLELRPDDPAATEVLEQDEAKRSKFKEVAERYEKEAEAAPEAPFRSALYASAADVLFRYGKRSKVKDQVASYLEKALGLDRKNRRAAALAEVFYTSTRDWKKVADSQALLLTDSPVKDERVAAGLRLGRTCLLHLDDAERAIEAYQLVLDLVPGEPDALAFLAEAYTTAEQWDHLVALYEDQLRGGGVKTADELGILVQIAMIHWRMRGQPSSAEAYFDRVRRADPAHVGMLDFFREQCEAKNDKARLLTILTDAQRASNEVAQKKALAAEIAKLAESQENAHKAIDQYKQLLRADPENKQARDALKRLYSQTEGYNALVELYRQELERTPADDKSGRANILREIAAIYRDRVKSEAALVTVLAQIVHLDERDIDSVRELTRVYESLGRWRDLLAYQQKLAELTDNHVEKVNLYRAAARRWLDQFSNVQNAVAAYEALLDLEPSDLEAQQRLRELYQKRRAWPQLYALYEKQVAAAEGADRIQLLMDMSKLAAERLDRGADAIALQKQILELDPNASGVFDALEKQAEREKDYATLAEVLEKRVAAATDAAGRLATLQKLGVVYAERLRDPVAAARTWRRVLEISPGHAKALRVLRESYFASGDWDGLEQLYATQNDWEGLVDFLSTAADKTTDGNVKRDVSFRAARVYEERLKAPERAMRSYERVLSVEPKNADAAGALVPIYEKEEKWARLPALYEVLLESNDDADKVALLRKLAAVTGGPLADKHGALAYAVRAYELSGDSEGLELLEAWARAAGSWGPFVEAIEARLKRKKGLTAELRRQLRTKLAEIYGRELGKIDEAVAAYRDLVETDPADEATVRTLDAILRSNGRRDDLRWLFKLRADQVEGEARAEILEEWATLEEEVFGDSKQATLLLGDVVKLAPRHVSALRALSRLLIAAENYEDAAEVVAQLRDASEGTDRARREIELAALYLDHLNRPKDAFKACKSALEVVAHDAEAIAILSRLVEHKETRVKAAAVLEAEYAEMGDPRREAQALRVMLEGERDPAERLALHLKLADVEDRKLRAAGNAFDVILRALNEAPDDLGLWDRALELAQKAGRPTDLAEAYRVHLVTSQQGDSARKLARNIEIELSERAASLHDEQLGDPEGAMPYLERVLRIDPGNTRAFARLKQILTSAERWGELEELYDTAAQGATDPRERIELLNEVALIAEEIIGDPAKAIGYYERILALDPLYSQALDALEKLYEEGQRWSDLAALLERRLESAIQDDSLDIKVSLGRIYLDRLHEPAPALGHLEDVLRIRENDPDARQLVERLLDITDLRQRAARVLEGVYEARDEIRALVRVLEIRREGAADESERRDLLRRISILRDERLRDDPGAFAALAELVPLEPDDQSSRDRFVEIGRRLGEHEKVAAALMAAADACLTPATRAEILMQVAQIFEDLLNDAMRAEAVYRRIVDIDPNDSVMVIPAAQALARIYAAESRHQDLAAILSAEVKLEESIDTRRSLYERIGTLYETVLDDPEHAIEAWRARLNDDPNDAGALGALERLYERTAQWRELVSVLHAREQSTLDRSERRRTMVRAAEILADKLQDVPEAIIAWRAVLDEFGPERSTLAALEALYEQSENWPDLAETLEVDLSLAEEPADRIAIFARLGDARRLHQSDLPGALDAYRQALQLDPSNERCRRALEAMLDLPEARRDAAEILHPLYEADSDSERLLRVLEIEVDTSDAPDERLKTLSAAMRTAEGPLGDAGRAFGYAVRGVRESVAEGSVTDWLEIVERLAESTGRWGELCALYQGIVEDIVDGDVQQNLRLRIGELARRRLDDRDLAVDQYKKALEARSDDRRAMRALEELHEQAGDSAALLEILKLRVEHAESDGDKKKLLYRVADLQERALSDAEGAIATYEAIIDIELDEDALAHLERLYAQASRYRDLITLHERQLEGKLGDRADLRVKIARIAHTREDDAQRAFEELAEALALDPTHEGAVAELEGFLESAKDPEHRARAAEMLEPVYLRRADWGRVKVVLEARLTASQDPVERRDLLQRLATLYEEQLEDYRAALEIVAKLLHEDLADEGVWREVERLAKVAGAERRLAEIYAGELEPLTSDDPQTAKLCHRTGEIYAALGEVEPALRWLRRAYEFDPESRELFDAIDKLFVKEGRQSERAELYRNALDYRSDADRLAALHTIAEIERRELGKAEQAIETYRSALDVDDRDELALDSLTELYRELERWRDLAELYLRRAEAAETGETAAPFRLAHAKLLRERLSDTTGAIDQLEAIVADVPWHEGAIKELELLVKDEDHKARVVEILSPLYERSDDWRKLVRLNEEKFRLATERTEKVDILRDTAKLWETRGGDGNRAFRAIQAAFDIDPEDGETRGELERLAAALGAWEDLAESYEHGVRATDDNLVRRELLTSVAKLYDERLDDPRRALEAYGRLAELDPSDPEPLEAMDTLAVLLSDWKTLITVLEKKSEIASDEDNAGIWRRIAETKLDMLYDTDGAIQAYERALELNPDSPMTLEALIALYEPKKNAERLVELYARRVELAEPDETDLRYDLNVRAAEQYETVLRDPREAITVLNAALEARPNDAAVLAKLESLYRAERMWDELLENLKLQVSIAETTEARVRIRTAIADLYATELESRSDALEQYALVLEDAPTDEHAIDAIFAIGEQRDEQREDAAAILAPVLRKAGKWTQLVKALEMRMRAQTDPSDRAQTLRTIATVEDAELGRPAEAEAALLRALEDTPDDPALHEEIVRMAEKAQGFERYCDVLEQRAGAIFDATVAKDLYVRLGHIAEERLKDDRRSVEAYAKAVEHAGDAPELLEALDRLYQRLGNEKDLADVLERRVPLVETDRDRADLYHRLARIQMNAGENAQALATLRQALEQMPEHDAACAALEALTDTQELFEEAAEALEGVYRTRGDNAALARLYEKRIKFAPSAVERVKMRLDLARVLEERASDPKAAQATLERALADDPADPDVLAEIERLAAITGSWSTAAEALEQAVSGQRDLTSDAARELWVRVAGWRKDRMDDAAGAERAYKEALKRDETNEEVLRAIELLQRVPGRERDLVATLRRLASLDSMGGLAVELRREAKGLAESAVADAALTEEILREMIAADDNDVWAVAELVKVREQAGDYKEVFALITRQAELSAEGDAIRELRHRAAEVARTHLEDEERAIEIYETIFEDEPSDTRASGAMRELYAKTGQHRKLLALLGRLVDLAESPEARSALRLESAALCVDRLDAPTEAIDLLRAVLEDEPGSNEATMRLSSIFETLGRDEDLADLLGSQIELARDRGDATAELSFRVRLGEVFEARLGDANRAIEAYRAVLEREPSHPGALEALARLYEQRGDKADAARTLETILVSSTGQEAVTIGLRLADLYATLNDDAGARRALERALDADGTAEEVRSRLRALYEKLEAWSELASLVTGDAEAASETAEKVVLYRRAASIHQDRRGDPASAADLLVKASELQPGDRELLLALCDAYSASGRGNLAAETLQKIIESAGGRRTKDLATIHHRLAKAYLAAGEKPKALAELDIAFKIDPGSIGILRDLGVLALELSSASEGEDKDGYIDRAQKTFRALLLQKLDDHSPISKGEVFYYLGEISHRQGDDKKAIQMLERALDNDKQLAPALELMAKLKGSASQAPRA